MRTANRLVLFFGILLASGCLGPPDSDRGDGGSLPDGAVADGGMDGGNPLDGGTTDAGGTDGGNTPDGGPTPDGGADGGTGPRLANVTLVINAGDSMAAGYNASNRTTMSYAGLLIRNADATYPGWQGSDLETLYGATPQVVDLSDSGADTNQIRANVLGASLPNTPGDILVLLDGGGNDLNDDLTILLSASATAAATATMQSNWQAVFDRVESRYSGQNVLFLVLDVHDPTDGLGTIPAVFDQGFCQALAAMDPFAATVLANLATFNDGVRQVVEAGGHVLVPWHDEMIGHGMNGGAARFIDVDCVHPTDPGHDLARQLLWESL